MITDVTSSSLFSGHIPQRRLQIGGTYADSCFYALSDFANDQRRNKRKVVILKSINRGRLAQEDLFPVSVTFFYQ